MCVYACDESGKKIGELEFHLNPSKPYYLVKCSEFRSAQ